MDIPGYCWTFRFSIPYKGRRLAICALVDARCSSSETSRPGLSRVSYLGSRHCSSLLWLLLFSARTVFFTGAAALGGKMQWPFRTAPRSHGKRVVKTEKSFSKRLLHLACYGTTGQRSGRGQQKRIHTKEPKRIICKLHRNPKLWTFSW